MRVRKREARGLCAFKTVSAESRCVKGRVLQSGHECLRVGLLKAEKDRVYSLFLSFQDTFNALF